jgi:hypothetical protein
MSQSPTSRMAAIKDDGFIDFYELLEVEPDATVTRIRTTINALYNDAQSNRDHRNLNRRREYQNLLQLIPQAREYLLEEKKRERYDLFRDDYQRGSAAMSFEDWQHSLKEEEENAKGDRSAVLGIQEEGQQEPGDGVPRATVIKAPKPKAKSRVMVGEEPTRPRRGSARQSLTGSVIAIGVFLGILIIGRLLLSLDPTKVLLVASIGGLIAWVATHRQIFNRNSV